MTINPIFAYIIGFVILCILIRIFYAPLRIAGKLCLNTILGGVILFLINLTSSVSGVVIGVNVFTALITGVLGVPGVATMLMMQVMFVT